MHAAAAACTFAPLLPTQRPLRAQVHYPGDTYRAINDAKRVTKVGSWLKNAELTLGDVALLDGTTRPRTIETWVPKKQITAWNPRCAAARIHKRLHLSSVLEPAHALKAGTNVSLLGATSDRPGRRTNKMGKKAVVFANGDLLLFRTVMDNRLAWHLEKHSVAVSKKAQPRSCGEPAR